MPRKTTANRSDDKFRCKLLPYRREELLTVQEVQQNVGWEITAFNLPAAWKYSQGEGVKVAVIDSGVDLDHPDLIENLIPGKNFVDPTKPPEDDCGHGTHVTGIICAKNSDTGMVGVAPKCKVMPVKALDKKGAGDLRTVAEAIHWSADQGVDFITMSLGSPLPVQQIRKAIQYAVSKGVVIFCAAGNAGKTREIFYPAAYPETIGVGAIDENFKRANFSCTGPDLDFLAPGVRILSTVPDNWYALMSGTSQANPFVVGVAAMLLSYKRAHNLNIKLDTNEDYCTALKAYTIPSFDPQFAGLKFFEGFGIIDPRKMEEWAASHSVLPPA
jgi:subtilisin family serine protease